MSANLIEDGKSGSGAAAGALRAVLARPGCQPLFHGAATASYNRDRRPPLAGAGPEESGRIVTLLAGLRTEYGMLLVEHDMQAVFALADRISVLVQGRLVVTGVPDAVRSHPEIRRAYLGEDEMA